MQIEQLQHSNDTGYLRNAAVVLFQSNEILQKRLDDVLKKLAEQTAADQLRLDIAEQLAILRKRMFGASSERSKDRPVIPAIQQELLAYNQPPVPEPTAEEKPALAIEEVIHDLPPEEAVAAASGDTAVERDSTAEKPRCPCCGEASLCEMKGQYEESSEITVIERIYKRVLHKRKKYTCKSCEKITTAPGAVKLQPKSEYAIEFAVQVAIDKYDYHLPLERQRRQMASAGLEVDTKTLYSQIAVLSDKLYPVAEAVKAEVLAQPVVHADESPMKVLSQNKKGYIWNLSNAYGSYYAYELSRKGEIAVDLIKSFDGTLLTDGYEGYKAALKALKQAAGRQLALDDAKTEPPETPGDPPSGGAPPKQRIKLAHCWAHGRRKFVEAAESFPQETEEILQKIGELYKVEHEAKTLEELTRLRDEKSRPLVAAIREWLIDHQAKVLPSSSLGGAIAYTLKLWNGLALFLDDPRIPLDNNTAERSLRAPVMGRNNFQGFRTLGGADVAMVFYTLIESAKRMRLNPHHYLAEMARCACRGEKLLTPYRYALSIRKNAAS